MTNKKATNHIKVHLKWYGSHVSPQNGLWLTPYWWCVWRLVHTDREPVWGLSCCFKFSLINMAGGIVVVLPFGLQREQLCSSGCLVKGSSIQCCLVQLFCLKWVDQTLASNRYDCYLQAAVSKFSVALLPILLLNLKIAIWWWMHALCNHLENMKYFRNTIAKRMEGLLLQNSSQNECYAMNN